MASLEVPQFPSELHVRLKVVAAETHRSLRSVVIDALTQYAAKAKQEVQPTR